jgi:chromate reductase
VLKYKEIINFTNMPKKLKVLGICGSLRKDSTNLKALKIALSVASGLGAEAKEADLKDLPLYNQDVFDAGLPAPVQKLFKAAKEADVIFFASPEYNYSVTGALKNAIDWLSRGEAPLKGKWAVILGASGGPLGTVRGQNHLRQVLTSSGVEMMALPQPQVLIKDSYEAFDAKGEFKDAKTREILEDLIKKTFALVK